MTLGAAALCWLLSSPGRAAGEEQRYEPLLRALLEVHGLSEEESGKLRALFTASPVIGEGNPAVTFHPMSREQCRQNLQDSAARYEDLGFERICGGKYMAPLYRAENETASAARVCVDQFEFPNIPCEYPLVWVRANEAAAICEALGKRLCDAHEWEGACAGSLEPPDYRFDLAVSVDVATAVRRMRAAHNQIHDQHKVWAYGEEYRTGICAAASEKTAGCTGGSWKECGSNTYPSGAFPDCRSRLGIYDLHGNAAEHMNLPLQPEQMASAGSAELGYTEMKGSWFIFDRYKAHEDACRWRAPYWHGSSVRDPHSHHNYHLGFRCCKTLAVP
jgi:formylglycine-generating enzyme required for sulfatase activity